MPAVTFPLTSAPGYKAQENGGRLVNAFVEELGDGARNKVVWRRAPGLRQEFETTGYSGFRGGLEINSSTAVVIMSDRALKVTLVAGEYVVEDLGALSGDLPVTMARNNRAPTPDIVVVSEDGAFIVDLTTGVDDYPDADVGSPNSVAFKDGYFFFTYGDGSSRASGINTTEINSIDETVAEARPDGLSRAVAIGDLLYLMGPDSIEAYQNTAQPTGYPFSRSSVIERGLAGPWAVAGWEPGWSNTVIFVADDNIVYRLSGFSYQRLSTHDLERRIADVSEKTTLLASVFMSDGHAFWCLRSPDWCWVYDLTTGKWHERKSYGSDTWRGARSLRAFGKWLIGDQATGKVFVPDADYHREGDDPLIYEITSTQNAAFPARAVIPRFEVDFIAGTGLASGEAPVQTAPRALIQWSDDGGYYWSSAVEREIGAQGRSDQRVTVHRTGLTGPRGRQWRITVSDPVYVGVVGAAFESEQRAR